MRNPKSAAYSGDFSDTVFTRQEEVGALPLPATYRALSIISHGIHGNRSTAGGGGGGGVQYELQNDKKTRSEMCTPKPK